MSSGYIREREPLLGTGTDTSTAADTHTDARGDGELPQLLMASRIGCIASEYTAASGDPRSILFEHTRPRAGSF